MIKNNFLDRRHVKKFATAEMQALLFHLITGKQDLKARDYIKNTASPRLIKC